MVNLHVLKPVIVKEFRQIRRDPTILGMLLVLPTALILLVGWALNFDVRHIPLAVFDQSGTEESRSLIEKFRHTEYFDHLFAVGSYKEIEDLFSHGRAKTALVIPATFGEDVLAGREVRLQVLLDGADANSANQAVVYAAGIMMEYSNRLTAETLQRVGRKQFTPIDLRSRVWYNPDLLSSKFLITGLMGFIIVLTGVISTSMTIVREKERGTMEQILVSPLTPLHIVFGKTIPYFLISLVAASAIVLAGYVFFDVPVRGSIFSLYLAIIAIILGALGQGLLISTITDSQQVAFMVSVVVSLLPTFLLSGFVFPISSMPIALQVISNIAVNKFFLIVVRAIMLKGAGLEAVWEQLVLMLVFAMVTLGISARRMRQRRVYAR